MNDGDAFASVEPLPESDQPLVPSPFVACTCTSYSVFSASCPIVALSAVIVVVVTSVQFPTGDVTR